MTWQVDLRRCRCVVFLRWQEHLGHLYGFGKRIGGRCNEFVKTGIACFFASEAAFREASIPLTCVCVLEKFTFCIGQVGLPTSDVCASYVWTALLMRRARQNSKKNIDKSGWGRIGDRFFKNPCAAGLTVVDATVVPGERTNVPWKSMVR